MEASRPISETWVIEGMFRGSHRPKHRHEDNRCPKAQRGLDVWHGAVNGCLALVNDGVESSRAAFEAHRGSRVCVEVPRVPDTEMRALLCRLASYVMLMALVDRCRLSERKLGARTIAEVHCPRDMYCMWLKGRVCIVRRVSA